MISPLAYIHPEAKIGENVEIAPFVFIRKSDSIGRLSGLDSTARESCDNAMTGTLSSLAITLSEREISDISCCLLSLFLLPAPVMSWTFLR